MLAVLLALWSVALFTSSPASATVTGYDPALAPYTQPINDTPLTNLLEVPTALPEVGPSAMTVPGFTYPAEWTAADNVVADAAEAGRFLPALGALGTVAAGAGALTVGWEIGSLFMKLTVPAVPGLGSDAVWAGTYKYVFSAGNPCFNDTYGCNTWWTTNAPGSTGAWMLQSTGTPTGVPGGSHGQYYCWPNSSSQGGYNNNTVDAGMHGAPGTELTTGNTGVCQGAPPGQHIKVITQPNLLGLATLTPTNAAGYAATDQQVNSGPYTQPTHTAADLTNARGVLGAPVASVAGGAYLDAAGHTLTPAQVQAQTSVNCELDASYCTGGANDPTSGAGPLSGNVTMPNCVGMTPTACKAALTGLGFVPLPAETTLTIGTADLTKPAGAVVSTSPAAGTVTSPLTTTVTLTENPSPLPLVMPAPLTGGETWQDYKARLQSLGFLGAITATPVSAEALNPAYGPDVVLRVSPAPGARVAPSSAVEIQANPSDAPDPGLSGGGYTPPTPPGFDLSPLGGVPGGLCDSFPFGVPCWVLHVGEQFAGGGSGGSSPSSPSTSSPLVAQPADAPRSGPALFLLGPGSSSAPSFHVPLPMGQALDIDLAAVQPIVDVLHGLFLVMSIVGIVRWLFRIATKAPEADTDE